MTLALVWIIAALLYLAFHAWYVGFQRPLTPQEVDDYCERVAAFVPDRVEQVRALLSNDSGRQVFMANYLRLHRQTRSGEPARALLLKYQKPFLKMVLKRGCHPIALALAAAPAVEVWGIDNAEHWDLAAFVRYRSRRDLAETLVQPLFHELHPFKLEAVEKTIAFPGDPARIIFGGPRLTVFLLLIAIAALVSLALR